MKLNKKTKVLTIIIILTIIAITGLVLANNISTQSKIVTRDFSSVDLVKVENDPTKIDVYLGMNDEASIANFQIGLDISMASCYETKFVWDQALLNNNPNLIEAVPTESEEVDEISGLPENTLNLYYVGTEELNQLDTDQVRIGRINIQLKDGEQAQNSSIIIKPREEFSKTVSLSHKAEAIKVDAKYTENIAVSEKKVPVIDNLTANVEAITTDDVGEGEEINKGSKIVVNFEVTDNTNSLTKLEVLLLDEKGNEKQIKTINLGKLEEEIPVSFIVKEEGNYKVQIKGTYNLGEGEPVTEILKTSSGDTAEEGGLNVVLTDEPKDPVPEPDNSQTTPNPPNTDDEDNPQGGDQPSTDDDNDEENGDQGNGDQENGDQGNGDQENGDQENGDQGNGDQGNGDQESGDQGNGNQENGNQPNDTNSNGLNSSDDKKGQ